MAMFKARVKVEKNIYIHNNIDQAAYYLKERVKKRAEEDDRDGIGLDMMACLTMLAFAVEAKINFLGYKLFPDWNERAPARDKVKRVLKHFGLKDDLKEPPYKTIDDLKQFRDTLAHGKPQTIKVEDEWTASEEELKQEGKLSAEYEKYLKEDLVIKAYEDIETIWKDLLTRSRLNIMDTFTHGGLEYTIIGDANDTKAG